MPAWSFHIKSATEISNILNLKDDEKDIFILANLIPDIKSGYLIPADKPVSSRYSHHYLYKNDLSLPNIQKYRENYFNKDDIISVGIFCHLLLDYYLNMLLKRKFFIYNEENLIIGIKTLNGVFQKNKEECIKQKHKNFNLIAKSINIKTDFSFPKDELFIPTDDGGYKITSKDIEMTEKWIYDNYKKPLDKFPKNELFTENDLEMFFKDSLKFVLEELNK